MTELIGFLLLLLAIYVSECFAAVPRGSLVIRTKVDSPASVTSAAKGFLSHWNLQFLTLLPGDPATLVCPPWPIPISGVGLCRDRSADTGEGEISLGRRQKDVPFSQIGEARASGRSIIISDAGVLRCHTSYQAMRIAALVARVSRLSREAREAEIEREVKNSFRVASARRLAKSLPRRTFRLALYCESLLGLLFVGLPVSVMFISLSRSWPWLAALLVGLVAAILLEYKELHRRYLVGLRKELRASLVKMALAPTAAVRAVDLLWQEAISRFDPLCVAAALCSVSDFEIMASKAFRELEFEPGKQERQEESSTPCLQWFRSVYATQVVSLAKSMGIDRDRLLRPPDRESPGMVGFCPRCHQQYRRADGLCADCPDVTLVRFERP